jgi:PIN domain nuclease of toxin-antitoxin system
MIAAVADTHAALWYLVRRRLSIPARTSIDRAAAANRKVVLSVISLAVILYLIEKKRLPFVAYSKLRQALGVVDYVIDEAPLTTGIVEAMRQVPRADVPDMPDRIAAATGIYFGVPVISRDGRIQTPKYKRSGRDCRSAASLKRSGFVKRMDCFTAPRHIRTVGYRISKGFANS